MSRGADPGAQAHRLHEVFETVLSGGESSSCAPRSLISASWQRSLAAHVDPDSRTPPVVVRDAELPDLRSAHPLNEVMPLLRSTLVSIADEAMHVMLVTDAEGVILWREGAAKLLHPADGVGLAPGTRWSEEVIGTNAMGTTLAVDAPVQIHSAEHLVRTYHAWTCAAAPVHDPDTGTILGAIDISGPLHTMHPGDGGAGVGDRAAGREPAAGAAGHRRRATAGAQHAAPDQPARAGRRAGHRERPHHRGRAVRGLAGTGRAAGARGPDPAR